MIDLIHPRPPVPRLLLNSRDAAEALGISPRTLWELTAKREIPVIRLPGRGKARRALRYDVEDLRKWVDRIKALGSPQDGEKRS
jgi:hypothetical protein